MLHEKNSINAGFSGLNNNERQLLDLKNTCQQTISRLHSELCTVRGKLAAKLKARKKSASITGHRAGIRKALSETSQYLNQAKELYDQSLRRADTDCLDLAVSIAREILQSETLNNTESLAKRITLGIEKLHSAQSLSLKVHQTHVSQMQDIFRKYPRKVTIIAENSVQPGNAVIETECGQVNLNWSTQLEMIHQVLLSKINSYSESGEKNNAPDF